LQDFTSRTTLVTWLEMTAPPARPPVPAPPGVEVRHVAAPGAAFYRELYEGVGGPWSWVARSVMSDAALAAIVSDPRVEVPVLHVAGEVAGYVELDRRFPPDIEIAYFGLMPAFIGRGLGRWLLDWAVERGWSLAPRRLWVHTCDLDHPRALATYERAGFRIYRRRLEPVLASGGGRPDMTVEER
jgi:GNAT superfamily N-acetyltransferase